MNWIAIGIALFIKKLVKISLLGVKYYVKFYFDKIYKIHQIVYLMIANICDNIFIFFELSNVHSEEPTPPPSDDDTPWRL